MSVGTVVSARGCIDELVASGALNGVFSKIDSGELELTCANGLWSALLKEALERRFQPELADHLGYDKGEPTLVARGNACNGTSTKMIDLQVGSFEIEVHQDRAGTFTPRLICKGQRRINGLDAMISSLYAGGMRGRVIRHHLDASLEVDLSAETISNITDAVAETVLDWQHCPSKSSIQSSTRMRFE